NDYGRALSPNAVKEVQAAMNEFGVNGGGSPTRSSPTAAAGSPGAGSPGGLNRKA
ncbi:hypothetical protein HDU76_011648, partial [Blyttiomyces sp. JEL0837]